MGMAGYLKPSGNIEADFAALRRMLREVGGHTPGHETRGRRAAGERSKA